MGTGGPGPQQPGGGLAGTGEISAQGTIKEETQTETFTP